MSLSPVAFFGNLDETNPKGTDSRTISDDQHRNILSSMKNQAPNWTAAIAATHGDVNLLAGYVAAGQKPLPGVGGITVIWFYANTVPTGYTIEAPDTNLRNLSIAPGGAVPVGGGTVAGTIDPSSTTLSVNTSGTTGNDAPKHKHDVVGVTGPSISPYLQVRNDLNQVQVPNTTNVHNVNITSADPDIDHQHPFTGTGTADFNPRRAMGVLGKLNA